MTTENADSAELAALRERVATLEVLLARTIAFSIEQGVVDDAHAQGELSRLADSFQEAGALVGADTAHHVLALVQSSGAGVQWIGYNPNDPSTWPEWLRD